MRLIEALQVGDGDVVAFVGAGGKTTTMFKLAHELYDDGKAVVVTTTTKIYPPTQAEAPYTLVEEDEKRLLQELERALTEHSLVAVTTSMTPEGKLAGVNGTLVGTISKMRGVSNVLIEADGAARKPFKAPLSYEPVIPECTTIVVPMVGVDAVGKELTEENVQRAEQVARLTGVGLGAVVSPELIARVMLHPEGNVKGSPKTARVVPVINKVEDETQLVAARNIAQQLFERGAERVVIAHSALNPPVVQVITFS